MRGLGWKWLLHVLLQIELHLQLLLRQTPTDILLEMCISTPHQWPHHIREPPTFMFSSMFKWMHIKLRAHIITDVHVCHTLAYTKLLLIRFHLVKTLL